MDARIVRTREALIAAIDEALHGDADKLPTITELCQSAGVSRPTFYQHFRDVPALVAAAGVDELLKTFAAASTSPEKKTAWADGAPRVIRDLLSALFAEGRYYRRVLEESDTYAFQERVIGYLTERMLIYTPLGDARGSGSDDVHLRRIAAFLAAGATWLVVGWIKLGPDRPSPTAAADEVSQLIITSIAAQAANEGIAQ